MDYDVIVIGSGPGGYYAASLLGKSGKKVLVIEKDKIGGVCLNIGCIPTKSLITISEKIGHLRKNDITGIDIGSDYSIDKTKINDKVKEATIINSKSVEYLFKKNSVELIIGEAEFIDNNTIKVGEKQYTAEKIIIASGSRNKDYSLFSSGEKIEKVISSTEALFLNNIPKSITIIGGGAIGVEFAYIFNSLGSSVTIIEYFPNLLPNMDTECGKNIERTFKKEGIRVITEAKLLTIGKDEENFITYLRKEKEDRISSEYILVALGRDPNSEIKGIEKIGITLEKKHIKVNEQFKTNIENIYAIGDVVYGKPLLAHTAYYDAKLAVNNILHDNNEKPNYNLVPFCIYSEPQVAGFGITEDKAKENGIDYKTVKSFFKSSGKAIAIDKTDGFVKLIIENKTEEIIGASIVGENATELIHTILLAAKEKKGLKLITETIFAHPTLSELIKDTSSIFYGENLH